MDGNRFDEMAKLLRGPPHACRGLSRAESSRGYGLAVGSAAIVPAEAATCPGQRRDLPGARQLLYALLRSELSKGAAILRLPGRKQPMCQ